MGRLVGLPVDFEPPVEPPLRLGCDLMPCVKHLTAQRQFQAVLHGKVLAATQHFVVHGIPASTPGLVIPPAGTPPDAILFEHLLGVVLPKRCARRAVTRNALRRQIYSVGDDFALALGAWACVVRLRREFDRTLFPSATSQALRCTARKELQALFVLAAKAAAKIDLARRKRVAVPVAPLVP